MVIAVDIDGRATAMSPCPPSARCDKQRQAQSTKQANEHRSGGPEERPSHAAAAAETVLSAAAPARAVREVAAILGFADVEQARREP